MSTEYENRSLHFLSRIEARLGQMEMLTRILTGATAILVVCVVAGGVFLALR